jgi:uncharacterized protein (TIGR03382 family)
MFRTSALGLLGALLFPLTALSYGGGVVGFSGKSPGQLCTGCHAVSTGTAPTVTLDGPATLNAGQTGTFSLTITGGPGVRAGMNVAASGTAAVLNAGAGSAKESGELRHASPLAFSSGRASFSFTVTAPSTAGTFTLFGAGNSTNGSGSGGDRSAYVTKVVTVTVVNQPPTISLAPGGASTTPTTYALSVGAMDDGGEAGLTYTWAATTAPAPVTFSANGTNAAKNTVATFTRAGAYAFSVTVRDAAGLTAVGTVSITVAPVVSSVAVSPSVVGLAAGRTQAFTATGTDQFGAVMSPGPTWSWSATGGTITAAGLYTAPATPGGPFTVTAASGGRQGAAQVTVAVGSPPTVATAAAASASPVTSASTTLTVLGADDGGEGALTYTWSGPAGVSFSASGTNAAKRTEATFQGAGTFALTVVIRDASNLTASSTVTMVVESRLQRLVLAPQTATVPLTGTQAFTVTAEDQFGAALTPAPAVTFTVPPAAGTITPAGLFRAGATAGGPFTVTASGGGQTAMATVSVRGGGPPVVSVTPTASPAMVLGKSTSVRVLGAAEEGEGALTYTWSATGPGDVSFRDNGTNGAKATTATFSRAGAYTLMASITNSLGMATTSTVDVTVAQSLAALSVTPSSIGVAPRGTQQFTAAALDQFGDAHLAAPAVQWTVTGGGVIDEAGLFTAREARGGPFTVTAVTPALRGQATVSIGESLIDLEAPTVALRGLADRVLLKGPVKLEVVATDNVGVTDVTWVLDRVALGTVTAPPFDYVLQADTLAPGRHSLEVVAQDAAGNLGRSAPVEVVTEAMERGGLLVGEAGCSAGGGNGPMMAALLLLALVRGRRVQPR